MTIRLSEVGEYSRAYAERRDAPEVSPNVVPTRAAREALQRKFGSLALTETQPEGRQRTALGELVQVVT